MSLQQKTVRMEQPGSEAVESVTSFLARYGRILLGALFVLVAGGAVAYFTLRARASAEEQAAGRLSEANVFYWQGDYARASQMAKQVYEQFGTTASGTDAHRLAGDAAFWSGDFKTAITEYRRYLDRDKSGLLADAVRRSLAYSLESDRQFAEAAKIYDDLIGHFDRTSSAEFLSSSARCYRELKQPAEAVKRLQRLVDEFGETAYSGPAQIELAELKALQAGR